MSTAQGSVLERKLYLLAGGLPPSVPRRFGIKNKEPVAQWELTEFKNGARADDLPLKHWERKRKTEDDEEEPGPYSFVKFNVIIDVPDYSPEEYDRYLRFDAQWGKAETDYLFDLCRQYDCRFPVIADVYEYADSKRSMEELEDRYFKLCKKLYESRVARGIDVEENQKRLDAGGWDYDKNMELKRKLQLETLYNRSYDQIKDEELLFTELKRRDAMNDRYFDSRQWAERIYGKHELSHSIERAQVQLYANANNDPRLKKKRRDDIPGAGPVIAIPQNRAPSLGGLPSATPSTPGGPLDGVRKEQKLVAGTSLRGTISQSIKGTNLQRVNEYLDNAGLPHQPTMPTTQVMKTYEDLRAAISQMAEWKKQEELLENNVKVLRIRRDNLNVVGSPTSPMSLDLKMEPGLGGKFPRPPGSSTGQKKKR